MSRKEKALVTIVTGAFLFAYPPPGERTGACQLTIMILFPPAAFSNSISSKG